MIVLAIIIAIALSVLLPVYIVGEVRYLRGTNTKNGGHDA